LLQVSGLSVEIGDRELIQSATFQLNPGDRVAIVGRNGTGKSTLFKVLTGQLSASEGTISKPKDYAIGYLKQHLDFTEQTLMQECKKAGHEDYQVEKTLFGLGFTGHDLQKAPSEFSGGFQIRIELAKCLLDQPQLLLLDEPGNYLDLVSLRWLKGFLNRYPGELMIISHDREFLDAISTHTLGIHRKRVKKLPGKIKDYLNQINLEIDLEEKTKLNTDKKIKDLQQFVDRFGAKASKATQAQSKAKQIEKLSHQDYSVDEKFFDSFQFNYRPIKAKNLGDLKNITFGYRPDKTIIKDLSINLFNKERLGVIGRNGHGKSSLLNLIAGNLMPQLGDIHLHQDLVIGHMGQSNIDRFSPDHTIVEEIQSANTSLSFTQTRSICATMGFSQKDADKKISVLSGGEKSRVMLAKILANPCNLLLMDEPTNHLDVESVEILKKQLAEFEGAVIFVSHEEGFIRDLADRLIVFDAGEIKTYPFGYKEFLEKIGWAGEDLDSKVEKKSLGKKEINSIKADLAKKRSEQLIPLKKEYNQLEDRLDVLVSNHDLLNQELVSASEQSDGKEISRLGQELGENERDQEQILDQMEKLESTIVEVENRLNEELNARLGNRPS
jgi:ATP-binding cassette subfamily F protein 3